MEVAGVVFRQSPCFSSTAADVSNSHRSQCFPTARKPNSFGVKQQGNRKSVAAFVVSGEFSDRSHLRYYEAPRMAVKEKEKDEMALKKKEMKKKLKVLKGLSKNLSTFSEMGFCLNPDDGLGQQVKGQMISEATEVLLEQLQKLKEEKMESERMKKEEKAKKKASRMAMAMTKTECKDSSSSESSSSESDCETENVVKMSQLKTVATPKTDTHQETTSSVQTLERVVAETAICKIGSSVNEVDCGKKIEVCMGGKCKKSGAAVLLENFQAAVGGEAVVVGCKCMGKCRDGPNVMVRNEDVAPNSLCIGVGLEDVDSIVSNFFGGSLNSGMVPALS